MIKYPEFRIHSGRLAVADRKIYLITFERSERTSLADEILCCICRYFRLEKYYPCSGFVFVLIR